MPCAFLSVPQGCGAYGGSDDQLHEEKPGVAAVGAVLTLGLGQAQAAPTPVAGVIVGGPTETTSVLGPDRNVRDQCRRRAFWLWPGFTDQPAVRKLILRVGNCELTYRFDNLVVNTFDPEPTESATVFSGGTVISSFDESPRC